LEAKGKEGLRDGAEIEKRETGHKGWGRRGVSK